MFLQRLFLLWMCLLPAVAAAQECDSLAAKAAQSEQPEAAWQQAAECYKSTGDTLQWLSAWRKVSSALMAEAEFAQAVELLEPVAKAAEGAEPSSLGWLYVHLGYNALSAGDVLRARDFYEEAVELFHRAEVENYNVGSYAYRQLGNIYTRLGDLEKARTLLARFLQLAIEAENPTATADAFGDLSIVLREQGDAQAATELCRQALALDGLPAGYQGDIWLHLAECLQHSSPELALAHAQQALQLYASPGARQHLPEAGLDTLRQAMAHKRIGLLKAATKQPEKEALQSLYKAHALLTARNNAGWQRDLSKLYIDMADLSMRWELYGAALENAQEALNTLVGPMERTQAPAHEKLYAENSLMEALILKAEAMKMLHRTTGDTAWLNAAHRQLVAAAEVERMLKNSYRFESSKLWLQAQGHSRVALQMDVLWELYQLDAAAWTHTVLELFESSRSNILLEAQHRPDGLLPQALRAKEQQLFLALQNARRKAASANGKLALAEAETAAFEALQAYEACQQEIAKQAPAYAAWTFTPSALNVAAVRDWMAAAQHDWLLEFYQGPVNTWALAISADTLIFKPLVHTERLQAMVQNWLPSIMSRDFVMNHAAEADQQFVEGAAGLGRVLITNVVGQLQKGERLAISPDGVLLSVPFEVLLPGHQPSQSTVDYRALPYLMRDAVLHYIPSVRVARQQTQAPLGASINLLAVAASYAATQLPELPGAAAEAQAVANRFSGQLLLNEAASKQQFLSLAPQADLLHLALHGIRDTARSEWSYLAFSASSDGDAKLYIPELYAHNLRARLAVLSACNSGAGEVFAGEGVMSLSRAFAYAGCRSTVLSLWPLADEASAKLMRGFYAELEAGAALPDALRAARLQYVESATSSMQAHPIFWAGLVSSGQSAPIFEPANHSSYWTVSVVVLVLLVFIGWAIRQKSTKRSRGLH